MPHPIKTTPTHPNREFTDITQLGLKAAELALKHKTAIEARLPDGTLAGLAADLDAFGVVVPGAKQARSEAKTATAAQHQALEVGYAKIQTVREAVRKAKAPKATQAAYSVGKVVKAKLVKDVKSTLREIIDRATANPAEAASFGIVQKDLTALTAAHDAITDADTTQEKKRASAPLSTQERNRVANRILNTVARISGAGILEFAKGSEEHDLFKALKPGPKSKKSAPAPDGGAEGEKGAAAPAAKPKKRGG